MCVRKRENKQDREGKSEKVSHTEGEGRVRMREGWGRERRGEERSGVEWSRVVEWSLAQ